MPKPRRIVARARGVSGALCLLVVLFAAAGLLAQGGADSPQAALAAAQTAGAERDVMALTALLAPSSLHLLASDTDMAAEFMAEMAEDGDTSLATALVALREKHGVDVSADDQPVLEVGPDTPQEQIDAHIDALARSRYAGVDLVAYVGELTALLVSSPAMAGQPLFPPGAIEDVRIDGDRATAQVGGTEIDLVREEGRWYVTQPK